MSATRTRPKTRLAKILDTEGRKQSWLAQVTGIDTGMLSRYVNGLHCPDDKQHLIAETLGRDVSDVFPPKEGSAAG
ncbi:MAG TPA: helix-turn-helix transcriptional regulator [Solirubrobacterales bacterium]|jgi:hypothetical protein